MTGKGTTKQMFGNVDYHDSPRIKCCQLVVVVLTSTIITLLIWIKKSHYCFIHKVD